MKYIFLIGFIALFSCNNSTETKKTETDSALQKDGVPPRSDSIPSKDSMTITGTVNNTDTIFEGGGNEPFWHIMVIKNTKIEFLLADEGKPVDFPYVNSSTLFNKAEVYETNSGNKKLRLEIRKKECSDGMSDLVYPFSISVSVNGKNYSGCGESATEKAKQ